MSKSRRYVEFAGYKTLAAIFAVLPRGICLDLGAGLGRLAFRIDRRHREIALRNLDTAFGRERPPAEIFALGRQSFSQLGRSFADILKATSDPRKRIRRLLEVEGRDHMANALGRGRGVLLFTAHFGTWEFASAAISEMGRLRVIARALDNPLIERDLHRLRSELGADIISKFGAAKPILQALGRNEIVAILIDLNVLRSAQPVFVDFFGKPAATTSSLAALHLKTGAPLVPMFCSPAQKGRYRVTIGEPLTFTPSDRHEDDVLKITRTCTKIIEQEIRRRPECWFWIHKRWHTRPADEVTTA